MMQLILLLTLVSPAYGAKRPYLAQETEVLLNAQGKFTKFLKTVEEADKKFSEMRTAASEGRLTEAEAIVDEIIKLRSLSRRRFKEIESLCENAERRKLNLNRLGRDDRVDLTTDFMIFLAMRKHNRRHGTTMELQLAAWRGMYVGKRQETLPSTLRPTGSLEGFTLNASDSLLIMTTNGGLVRGRFVGMIGNSYVIRNVLYASVRRRQEGNGLYRVIDLNDVARIEIIRKPPTISDQANPLPTITDEGGYARYFVRTGYVWRANIRPSDTELLEHLRGGTFGKHASSLSPIPIEEDSRPAFTSMFFYDCENSL